MKHIFITIIVLSINFFICCSENNVICEITNTTEAEKEAVEIVTAIADNVADLIILHKHNGDATLKKERSITLIKYITEIITKIIIKAKSKKKKRNIIIYDDYMLEQIIEDAAKKILEKIEAMEETV